MDTIPDPTPAIAALRDLLGDRLSTGQSVRDQHSRDISRLPPRLPDAVAFPETEAEVQAILTVCHDHGIAVTPFGAGSSMEGHTIHARAGITVNTSRMNAILSVQADDGLALVQPGVARKALNTHLRDTGLMFSVDPGADANLGGMASTRGSGTTAVRYGTMPENVLALRAVVPGGAVVRAGSQARKSSTGSDLAHLVVEWEGTLGIIIELTLRLHPIPEAVSAAICTFPTTRAAIDTVIAAVQMGVPLARCEFLDEVAVGGVNAWSKLSLTPAPTLLFEVDGAPDGMAEQAAAYRAWPLTVAGPISSGQRMPRNETASGRRGMTCSGPPRPCAPAPACGRATSACRSRAWPMPSTTPAPTFRRRS